MNNNYTDTELEDLIWDRILKLELCPMGHIVSPRAVVITMRKLIRELNDPNKKMVAPPSGARKA